MSWDRQIILKNPAEIAIMREAGRVNASVHAAIRELLQPGVSTADLDAAAEEVLRKHGAVSPFKGYGYPPFPNSITVSINEELVHGIPSAKRKLQEGDLVSVDCGTLLEGYVGDSAFSAGVGKISARAQKLLDVTEQALQQGIAKMHSGNHTGDVSAAIQQYVESHGFFVTREYTGHGVGRNMHEGPQVPNYGKPGTGVLLRPGMVIALEPMVLVGTSRTKVLADKWTVVSADGSLTAHFEHSVAVTEGEPILLTVL
ncbi:MAG: type I methionyl aminopeptidase [Anaerolineae bacterium CG_4_9_14_3_um_filter_57_17]|nr:type I methionyl aminopeptidase [bacterium]NCT20912.1 type I methionyl aminopeptidase [bacterium]OIO85036.1 MAG: type I methionyl aminopeptidase [Anaerolineae bacterium CG2_30_57_67]PJB68061.1 MAG: type I methionyl aminopeptidase [Anaerolineae bacterium CG_4_9_14_3_um_filter_57_17]